MKFGKLTLDLIGDVVRRPALPEPHHRPPGVTQRLIGRAVTGYVALDLRTPIPGVGLRRDEVLWATVPETAVYEDHHLEAGEGNVGRAPQPRHGSIVRAVTATVSVKE